MADKSFDIILIGTGVAAQTAAPLLARNGRKCAVVDSRPFGGTCPLRGCDPKKVLVGVAEAVDQIRRFAGRGVTAQEIRIDWPALIRFKRTFTDPVPEQIENFFSNQDFAIFHGQAHFLDPHSIRVGEETLTAERFLIASGAKPAPLPIPGAEHLLTSDRFMELETLPRRLVTVGGGYISFEFAHLAARAGSEVVVLERSDSPLPMFDAELVDRLLEASRDAGIDVRLNTTVKEIGRRNERYEVSADTDGEHLALEADLVLHAAGRVPEIDDLNPEAAGIEREKKGISVNRFLQSVSAPHVYAAGDAAAGGGPPLTPVARLEGRIAAENMIAGNRTETDYTGVPSVVFTIPPLASAGLSEREARDAGIDVDVHRKDTADWYFSRRRNIGHGGAKILTERKSGRLVGAHFFGPEAEEVINVFALAIRRGMSVRDLTDQVYAYPSIIDTIRSMV